MNQPSRSRGPEAVVAFAFVTFVLALVQCFCLGTGVLGFRLGRPAAIIGLIGIVLLSVLLASRFRRPASGTRDGTTRTGGAHSVPWFAWGIAGFMLAWTVGLWARLLCLAWLRPCYDWDGLYYHLPAISGWAAQGHVGWLNGGPDVPFVNFPMGVEVTTYFMHLVCGTSRLATAGNLWFWPLAVLSVVVIAALLGAAGPWRWLSGAWITGASVLVCQSVTCYTDPGFAATAMGALAASGLLVFDEERPLSWRLVLWGASLGLMAGAKGTGAPFAAVMGTAVFVATLLVHGRDQWMIWAKRLGLAVCVAVVVGGYWYVRNAIVTGNPIHPIELKFGERVLFPGYDYVAFSEANLPSWLAAYPRLLRMPVSWLQMDAPIHGYDPVGGLGYLWLFGCVPALLVVAIRHVRRRSDPAAKRFLFFACLCTVLLAAQTSTWWSRFTVWLLALGLPSLAWVLQLGSSVPRRWLRVVSLLLIAAASGLVIWESHRTLASEEQTGRIPNAAAGGAVYRSTADVYFPRLTETPGLERFLAADKIARGPWGRLGMLFAGVLAQPLGARAIEVLPATLDDGDVLRLHEEGVGWVVWDVNGAGPAPEALRRAAVEEVVYNPVPDADFHFFDLGQGGR
jgi:hypothetical protein